MSIAVATLEHRGVVGYRRIFQSSVLGIPELLVSIGLYIIIVPSAKALSKVCGTLPVPGSPTLTVSSKIPPPILLMFRIARLLP